MQVSAVNVSLTAGDSARIAISTSWSMANARSWRERAVRPGGVGSFEPARDRRRGVGRPDQREREPSHDEVARAGRAAG